jgi:hypothetical protein
VAGKIKAGAQVEFYSPAKQRQNCFIDAGAALETVDRTSFVLLGDESARIRT